MGAGRLTWDAAGQKYFETGAKMAVLYPQDNTGAYPEGVAWNGFRSFTKKPTGAEKTKLYANDSLYGVMTSAEELEGTLTAYTYPDEFAECDGSQVALDGVTVGQQKRKTFGFCYRTMIGNDIDEEAGYKLHLVYGCSASPSEKAYQTVGDSPEAIEFSWDVTMTPVTVGTYNDIVFKPTAEIVIDSRKFTGNKEAKLTALEAKLYGTDAGTGTDATTAFLPLPAEVFSTLAA